MEYRINGSTGNFFVKRLESSRMSGACTRIEKLGKTQRCLIQIDTWAMSSLRRDMLLKAIRKNEITICTYLAAACALECTWRKEICLLLSLNLIGRSSSSMPPGFVETKYQWI